MGKGARQAAVYRGTEPDTTERLTQGFERGSCKLRAWLTSGITLKVGPPVASILDCHPSALWNLYSKDFQSFQSLSLSR